jgi:hypothetical protein
MEVLIMRTRLRLVTPLTLVLLAACSDNHIDVGSLDAGPTTSTGTGGSGTDPTGNGGTGGSSVVSQGSDASPAVDTGSTGTSACDPFAPTPKPIALGTIIGAGQSANGTIYVADQVSDSSQRIFISDASGTLVRQRGGASGTGSGTDPDFWVFGASGPDATFVLEIDKYASGLVRMGVLQGTLTDRKQLVIGQDGEELTVLAASAVTGRALRNLPGDVYLEYVATTPDGAYVVVTRPLDDWSYSDFRLFLGPLGNMVEHKVTYAMRAHDGGSTIIDFDLDGAPAEASFRVAIADGGLGFVPGPATLTVSGTTTTLTRLAATPPAGAAYLCL